ncbi:MarR family transcriptional regulator [Patiriisocius marinistellae]|uniref:MarR family transcriptional regulator n=1 Tax=Patiriisocius marinistellae TaxID=2494560 RepID=A0A5J4FYE5_9FLAO|nr:MarR family transcriptional regulator [Patiriisocius marinistellae]GEQ87280.1 MarR family transcriptional regulator [Patiriisocius marinistellae]
MNIEQAIQTNHKMNIATKTAINVAYTSRIMEESFLEILKPHDITPQQFNVLRILRGQKGNPANLSTIQERMVDRNSNTTRLIDKLIKKDLVTRRVCASNRRKIELFITKEGLSLLTTLDPITQNNNEKITSALDANELEQLNNLLDKLRTFKN